MSSGYAGRETNDVHRYSVADNTWTELESWPEHIQPRSVTANCTLKQLNLILLFGGEVSISAKGHEGAGGFQNDFLCLNPDTGKAFQIGPDWADEGSVVGKHENGPCHRGWLDGAEVEKDGSFAIFGGLGGNDDSPIRYNDLWVLKIEKK